METANIKYILQSAPKTFGRSLEVDTFLLDQF